MNLTGNESFTQEKFRALFEERSRRVLALFRQNAVSGVSDPKLLEVLHFVCDYWKDNFRPAFASFCCEAVGGTGEAADDVSLMITLTSAGGGIHDDIVDKSSNKHFRMTVLGEYGLDCALLVGDLLIQKGWALIRDIQKSQPDKLAEIVDVFGRWTLDVCEAEFMEIQCRQTLETELNRYENLLSKSIADTQACARLGSMMGGGSKSEIEALSRFATRLGFMFRLADDLKDVLDIEYNLFNRLRYESVPLPILYAAKTSGEIKPVFETIVKKSFIGMLDLQNLLEVCKGAGAFNYVDKRAKETRKDALKNLEFLGDTTPKRALAFIINDIFSEISELVARVS